MFAAEKAYLILLNGGRISFGSTEYVITGLNNIEIAISKTEITQLKEEISDKLLQIKAQKISIVEILQEDNNIEKIEEQPEVRLPIVDYEAFETEHREAAENAVDNIYDLLTYPIIVDKFTDNSDRIAWQRDKQAKYGNGFYYYTNNNLLKHGKIMALIWSAELLISAYKKTNQNQAQIAEIADKYSAIKHSILTKESYDKLSNEQKEKLVKELILNAKILITLISEYETQTSIKIHEQSSSPIQLKLGPGTVKANSIDFPLSKLEQADAEFTAGNFEQAQQLYNEALIGSFETDDDGKPHKLSPGFQDFLSDETAADIRAAAEAKIKYIDEKLVEIDLINSGKKLLIVDKKTSIVKFIDFNYLIESEIGHMESAEETLKGLATIVGNDIELKQLIQQEFKSNGYFFLAYMQRDLVADIEPGSIANYADLFLKQWDSEYKPFIAQKNPFLVAKSIDEKYRIQLKEIYDTRKVLPMLEKSIDGFKVIYPIGSHDVSVEYKSVKLTAYAGTNKPYEIWRVSIIRLINRIAYEDAKKGDIKEHEQRQRIEALKEQVFID